MKPAYWIGILALAGAVIGYAVFRSTGVLGTILGLLAGMIIGVIVYRIQTGKPE